MRSPVGPATDRRIVFLSQRTFERIRVEASKRRMPVGKLVDEIMQGFLAEQAKDGKR